MERARGGAGIIIAWTTFVTTFASKEAYTQPGDFVSFIKVYPKSFLLKLANLALVWGDDF